MSPASSEQVPLSRRVVRRLRPSGLNELKGLLVRLEPVEVAAAENRLLRSDLERVVTEVEEQVAAYAETRRTRERALSHDAPTTTDG